MPATRFNAALGRALADSPRAGELCRELAGRSLRLDVSGTPLSFLVRASDTALVVTRVPADTAADVTISGAPFSLLAAAGGDVPALIARGGLTLAGDEALALRFQALAALLRPDLETLLAPLGRIPAHLATRGILSLHRWGRAVAGSALRSTADYLAHESRDLLPRAEAEVFLSGVEALRHELARTEARATQATQRLDQLVGRRARSEP
jgi:ubiquinone biosynthesis protein UbiJ